MSKSVNSFFANSPILYPQKRPRNIWFSFVFSKYKMRQYPKMGSVTKFYESTLGCNPAGIHLFKVNYRSTRTGCESRSQLTIGNRRRLWQ